MNDIKGQNQEKLSFQTKFGYGVATAGDGAVYNFVGIYFLFFLTTVAGVDAGKAGMISSTALLASALFTIFIGYFSDNSRCKSGRRRPYIRAGLPVLFISFIAMFTAVDFPDGAKVAYYGIFAILFWLAYAMFYVPYTALGAEITSDYDDRTRIRTYAVSCNSIGNIFGMVFPLILVGIFVGMGQSSKMSWIYTAVISGTFAILAFLYMLKETKGKELIIKHKENEKRPNIFTDYVDVLKAKPCKYLILSIFIAIISYSIFNGSVAYFVTFNLGLPESYTSTVFVVLCVAIFIFAPLINKIATQFGKREAYMIGMVVSAVLLILFQWIGIENQVMLLVLGFIFTLGAAAYWQLMSAIIYDLTEVIELSHGKRSEGTLSSLQSIFQQLGTSAGMMITGWILEFTGFNGTLAVQSESALQGIQFLLTIVPAIGFILAAATMYFFPLTKKKYELVQKALEEKKATGKYSKEGLEKIVS